MIAANRLNTKSHNHDSIKMSGVAVVILMVLQCVQALLEYPQNTKCRLDYKNLPATVKLDPGCSHVTCGSNCGAPCPGSRDCQQNGLLLCREVDLDVPFMCAYDSEECYIFHKVSSCGVGGTLESDGSCTCQPGYVGQFCHQYVQTCYDIYIRNNSSISGEYSLATTQGAAISVWCSFRSDVIVTYFSKSSIAELTTEELSLHYNDVSEVNLLSKWTDGSQKESTMKQISSYSSTPLRYMVTEDRDYSTPSNTNMGPYLYFGLLPSSEVSRGMRHGYIANDAETQFTNCDGNPNNYFVFFSNPTGQAPTKTGSGLRSSGIMGAWQTGAVTLTSEENLPDNYFYETELHFGGCGGFSISTTWSEVFGLNLGLRYTLP